MQVHECMMLNPITISPKATYSDAFHLMRLKKLAALPVVDKEAHVVGLITAGDLLDLLPAAVPDVFTHSYPGELLIEEVMTKRLMTVSEDCPVEEAARIMIDHEIGSLPVMRGQQLVGFVTETDIFRAMMTALGGRLEGLRVSIQLTEDQGELGAITDGIVQLGGKLISLSAFWGNDSGNRMITLKVQGADPGELIRFLEKNIGVQVISFCAGCADDQAGVISPETHIGAFPIHNLEARVTGFRDPK